MGKAIDCDLRAHGITPSGYVVDDQYANENIISRTYLLNSGKPYAIVRGFEQALLMTRKEVLAQWPNCVEEFMLPTALELASVIEPISEEYYKANRSKFEQVREKLADELSKQSLDAFLKLKTTGECLDDPSLIEKNLYFGFDVPWRYSDDEVYFDCGAYDGDSINAFIQECKGKYQRVLACEPDTENFQKLSDNVSRKRLKNVDVYPLGIYNKKDVLVFLQKGTMGSSIGEATVRTGTKIEVDSIDNILSGKPATIIKMDIEGSERYALTSAEKMIKKCRPILMICVYHRKDDIFTLFEQINSYVGGYKYYLRWHEPLCCDLVLYAVPEERITG